MICGDFSKNILTQKDLKMNQFVFGLVNVADNALMIISRTKYIIIASSIERPALSNEFCLYTGTSYTAWFIKFPSDPESRCELLSFFASTRYNIHYLVLTYTHTVHCEVLHTRRE